MLVVDCQCEKIVKIYDQKGGFFIEVRGTMPRLLINILKFCILLSYFCFLFFMGHPIFYYYYQKIVFRFIYVSCGQSY